MAVSSAQVSVGTAATIIASGELRESIYPPGHPAEEQRSVSVLIKRPNSGADIYLGGSDVTTANGYPWTSIESALQFVLEPGEVLYGRVAAGTQTVDVLRSGQ